MAVESQTIFGGQIREQIVRLIENMWNALARLSLCIFWQAAFQLQHQIVGLDSARSCVNACLCGTYSNEDIGLLQFKTCVSNGSASPDHLTFIWI